MSDLMHQDFSTVQSNQQQKPVTLVAAARITPLTKLTFLTGSTPIADITPPVSGYVECTFIGLAAEEDGDGPPLGDARRFAVLGGTTVTNTGASVVTGDLGLSPGTSVTGFPPGLIVNGEQHVADTVAADGQLALTTLYNALAAMVATETLAPGVVIGTGGTRPSFGPGVYDWATAGQLTGTVTLTGDADDVFVFRTGTTFTSANASAVVLAGGALAKNVFFLVGSSATFGTTSAMIGNVVALTSITATTGGTFNGRLLARNGAVTLDTNTVNLTAAGGSGTEGASLVTTGNIQNAYTPVAGVPYTLIYDPSTSKWYGPATP